MYPHKSFTNTIAGAFLLAAGIAVAPGIDPDLLLSPNVRDSIVATLGDDTASLVASGLLTSDAGHDQSGRNARGRRTDDTDQADGSFVRLGLALHDADRLLLLDNDAVIAALFSAPGGRRSSAVDDSSNDSSFMLQSIKMPRQVGNWSPSSVRSSWLPPVDIGKPEIDSVSNGLVLSFLTPQTRPGSLGFNPCATELAFAQQPKICRELQVDVNKETLSGFNGGTVQTTDPLLGSTNSRSSTLPALETLTDLGHLGSLAAVGADAVTNPTLNAAANADPEVNGAAEPFPLALFAIGVAALAVFYRRNKR